MKNQKKDQKSFLWTSINMNMVLSYAINLAWSLRDFFCFRNKHVMKSPITELRSNYITLFFDKNEA